MNEFWATTTFRVIHLMPSRSTTARLSGAARASCGKVSAWTVPPVTLGSEPWFDQQHATGREVAGHRSETRPQPFKPDDVPDRAEQAHHRIEGASELEVEHVPVVEAHLRVSLAGDSKQVGVEVQAFGLVAVFEEGQVASGATTDVQQRIGGLSHVRPNQRID